MLKEEITKLITWKGEEFELDMNYEDYLLLEKETKERGEDGLNVSKYRRYIKFSSIEHKIGKTKYLALKAPKERELTQEEIKNAADKCREIHEKWKENPEIRKKKFLERRENILHKLANEEKILGFQTTLNKLELYNKSKVGLKN